MKINSSVKVLSIFFGFSYHLLTQAAPNVLSTTPVHNATNTAPNASIAITFDASVDPSTFTNSTIRINGSISGLHTGTFSYNSSSFTATVVPNQPFKVGEIVTVAVTRGIKSAAGDSLANSFLWSFLIKGGTSSGLFEQVSSVSVGNDPYLAVAADLNGDGAPDLVTVNNYSNSLSLLKNNGNGTFTLDSTLGVGSYPTDVVAADFNGDGAIDLAVTGGHSNSVSIFKNNGHGVFTLDTTYNFESVVWGLVAADFDGDGAIDLAVNITGSNSVVILKNNGNGKFTQSSTTSVGDSPRYILARDFDNDGAIDLAVLNFNSMNVSILKNNGQIVLTQAGLVRVVEIAGPTGIDSHALQAHAIHRQKIRRGQGDPMRHRRALRGTVAFHALEPVHDPDSPVGGEHSLGGHIHVVVARTDAYVKLALLALGVHPRRLPRSRRSPWGRRQRRCHDYVLDRHGGDHEVMRLQYRRGNDESIGIHESRSQPDGDQMHVVVDSMHEPPAALLLIGNLKLQVHGLVLGEDFVPAEPGKTHFAWILPGISEHHGTFETGSQVVEDPSDGIGLGGGKHPFSRLDTIGFQENVLLGLESRPDLVVDRDQRIINVLAPVFTLDQRHCGAAIGILEILGGIGCAQTGVRPLLRRRLLPFQCQPLRGSNGPRASKERSARN